jgi:hypothetical protein
VLRRKLDQLQAFLRSLSDVPAAVRRGLRRGLHGDRAQYGSWISPTWTVCCRGPCVFEGAQGVLLDEWRGFHPYTTWSTTTFDNVAASARRLPARVLRCFTTRHGAGPMVTEDARFALVDPHNPTGPWQGAFRVGHFDAVAHRYALEVAGGVDGLALTHLDVAAATPSLRICRSYQLPDATVTVWNLGRSRTSPTRKRSPYGSRPHNRSWILCRQLTGRPRWRPRWTRRWS